MPDLLTHTLATYLGSGGALPRRLFLWLALGSVLPDAAAQAGIRTLHLTRVVLGWEAPGWAYDGFHVFHSPLPYALLCLAIVFCFAESERVTGLALLLAAGLGHLGLDLLQRHLSGPSYFLAFPFSRQACSLDLLWTEDSLLALPVLVAIATALALLRRRQSRQATPDHHAPEEPGHTGPG